MEREYADLVNEAAHVTYGAVTRRMYTRTLWTLRALYESDLYWIERIPTCFTTLRHTWLMDTVTEIAGKEDCDQWLNDQYDEENFRHPEKTPARMAEIASLSRNWTFSPSEKAWAMSSNSSMRRKGRSKQ